MNIIGNEPTSASASPLGSVRASTGIIREHCTHFEYFCPDIPPCVGVLMEKKRQRGRGRGSGTERGRPVFFLREDQ